ncbi:hypothetical protein ACXR6G_18275 [Ancylomarina sp. YFZ004]
MNFKIKVTAVLALLMLSSQIIFAQFNTKVIVTDLTNKTLKKTMQSNASVFLSEINTAFAKKTKPRISSKIISNEAISSLLSMWEMSNFRCYETDIIERAIKRAQGGYEIRNIPIFMQEAPEEDQYQEMVFVFSDNGMIDNIYISMETNRYNKLISEGEGVTEYKRRQIILDFLENFRTAYNRKDIDYLNKVYSEDALIITGKVITVTPANKDMSKKYLSDKIITYQKQTKEQYLSKLKGVFQKNSYINIKFSEIEIKKHRKYPDIYGVNMMQGWNTTRYSDVGYLFLMIDFSDDNNPLIHVRTWQPEKIGNITLSEDEKFKLEMFNPQK